MTENIKPCPFCGSEAEYWSDCGYADRHVIECQNCGCSRRSEYYEVVFEDWNTRDGSVPVETASDSQYADKLTEMLLYFRDKHIQTNQNLHDIGEGKHTKSFETISVEDIKRYVLRMKGVDERLLGL